MSFFYPKLFSCLKDYNINKFYKDLTSGIIVAIIALPLSIALAIASGVTPEKGLHTAIIAGFLISFLGGSRVQIGGPTGAFMIIVLGIVTQYGLDGLIISTIMAGIIMVLMGVFKLGRMIKFIPYPITTGFTSGIALVIFSTQIKDFLGLSIDSVPGEFLAKWETYFTHIGTINWQSLLVGGLSLLIIIFWPRINKKIPGSLIALIVATIIVYFLKLDVETIGSKFGVISSALPMPRIPVVNLQTIKMLLPSAITIALLGSIESLLSAVVADGMIGGKHRSNTELIAQGIANIASGLFGGIPATGAIARTAANVKNGGRTPIAGIVHALVLLLILLVFMPLAKLIPLSCLAAILMVVAYNMSHWRAFKDLMGAPKSDIFVLLTTFSLTVLIDLVVAIEVGMVMASMLFMKRMSDITVVKNLSVDSGEEGEGEENLIADLSSDTIIYDINGPFFFGAADKFTEVIYSVQSKTKVIILKMSNVPAMDATAIHALENLYRVCKIHKTKLVLNEVQEQPYHVLEKAGFIGKIGEENISRKFDEEIVNAS
ncbi:MAG: high affinity sulfate transporter 1 [Clostridia bacterium]|nr:high affinity sulfate transporter 1 [Clostridia bacterium]